MGSEHVIRRADPRAELASSVSAGRRALTKRRPIQAKLRVGAADDPLEREADRIAAAVVSGLERGGAEPVRHGSGRIRRAPQSSDLDIGMSGGEVDADTDAAIRRAAGGGRPLDESVRTPMEQSFGADFSRVRVHVGGAADDLNQRIQAKAFTTGPDVFFARGQYEPGTARGDHLMAHELTHVVQQGGGASQVDRSVAGPVIRRVFDFASTAKNDKALDRRAALDAFGPSDALYAFGDFVRHNAKAVGGGAPFPSDVKFSATMFHADALASAKQLFTSMGELRGQLADADKPTKQFVDGRRRKLQELWTEMLQVLGDDYKLGETELAAAADAVGRALWMEAGSPKTEQQRKQVLKKRKAELVTAHKGECIRTDADIQAAAEVVVKELTREKKGWEIAAMKLSAPDYTAFTREKAMVLNRLARWETVKFDALGCNPDGTWGTSFGGTVLVFTHNPLNPAVWGVLEAWWLAQKGQTHVTDSHTTDKSLKKARDGNFPTLSPMFNYHIQFA